MSARQQAIQQTELQELVVKLSTTQGSEKLNALGRIVALDAQSVDCLPVLPLVQQVPQVGQHGYTRARRFVGILNENYIERTTKNVAQEITNMLSSDFRQGSAQDKAIAVRHAGRLANDENVDKLVQVVQLGASSNDPYVRKAAALAILNLHETKPSYIDKYKLGGILKNLVEDANPNVAANAVAALTEINAIRTEMLFVPTATTVNNLLAAIDQATEWSQVEILDFVATYKPRDSGDARGIIARVASRLSHANAAVVISAIRCCLRMNMFVDDQAKVRDTLSKVVLPLVTLLNGSSPIQYIAVKSILVLLQHYKRMLSTEVTIFFCKYDDPLYIKLAKLDVVLSLVNTQNVGKVLEEVYDYAQQTDVEFVRKSIRAIGKIAVQFESASAACVDKIVALVNTKVHFVVQECIVVAVDIFRRYPGKFEGIIANINAALTDKSLDDHRAKAAMVWIFGEYADSIGNAGDLLEALFIDDFVDEPPDVQLAILTAVVKYYLISGDGDDMLRKVIKLATTSVDNPDIRDRAFQYYWLISEAGDQAEHMIFPDVDALPKLNVELFQMNPDLVAKLVPEIGTLAVLYNKLPHEFVQSTRIITLDSVDKHDDHDDGSREGDINSGLAKGASSIESMALPVLVEAKNAYGVEIRGTLMRIGDENSFVLRFTNYSDFPLDMKQIAFNKNIFGFAPGDFDLPPTVRPQKTVTVKIPVIYSQQHLQGAQPSSVVQIAVLVNRENTIFFEAQARLDLILVPADQGGKINRDEFTKTWQGIDDQHEFTEMVEGAAIDSIDMAKLRMQQNRLFFCAKKGQCAFFTGRTIQGEVLIVFLSFGAPGKCLVGVKMWNDDVAPVIRELVKQAIQ